MRSVSGARGGGRARASAWTWPWCLALSPEKSAVSPVSAPLSCSDVPVAAPPTSSVVAAVVAAELDTPCTEMTPALAVILPAIQTSVPETEPELLSPPTVKMPLLAVTLHLGSGINSGGAEG